MKNNSLESKINAYKRKGGKKSRRATIERMRRFIAHCQRPAEQIGRRQVHEFYAEKKFSASTERDYFYAISLLWQFLERSGEPPRPPSMPPQ